MPLAARTCDGAGNCGAAVTKPCAPFSSPLKCRCGITEPTQILHQPNPVGEAQFRWRWTTVFSPASPTDPRAAAHAFGVTGPGLSGPLSLDGPFFVRADLRKKRFGQSRGRPAAAALVASWPYRAARVVLICSMSDVMERTR